MKLLKECDMARCASARELVWGAVGAGSGREGTGGGRGVHLSLLICLLGGLDAGGEAAVLPTKMDPARQAKERALRGKKKDQRDEETMSTGRERGPRGGKELATLLLDVVFVLAYARQVDVPPSHLGRSCALRSL